MQSCCKEKMRQRYTDIHLHESCHGAKYENYQNNVLSTKINNIIAN